MKPFNGYETAKESVKFEGLPRGGYELVIMSAKPIKWVDHQPIDWTGRTDSNPDYIEIYVDVDNGVYKGYFANNYRNQTSEDKKWRGIYKLYIPKEDGTKEDGWTKNTFARTMNAIEDSNAGYRWTWDERTLKGLKVGGLFNMRQYQKGDGKTGNALNVASLIDIHKIQSGDYKVPDDKLLPPSKYVTNTGGVVNSGFLDVPDGNDDGLPFR